MKIFGLAVILVAPLGAGTTLTVTAQTAPAGLSGQLGAAADSLNMLEQTQYIYGGRRYCWYFDGWFEKCQKATSLVYTQHRYSFEPAENCCYGHLAFRL